MKFVKGSTVRFLRNGTPSTAVVTHIFEGIEPVRFEGDLVVQEQNEWLYPGEGDKHIWAYVSDILEVIKF